MSSEIAVTRPELVLLQMMIDNDYALSEADKQTRDVARASQRDAMEDELEAMQEQADAIRTGAVIEGGLQMGSGATAIGATVAAEGGSKTTAKHLNVGANLAGGLAEPAGKLYGKAHEVEAQRDAGAASQAQEVASWLAEDAEEQRGRSERHAQAMLDQVQGILDTEQQKTAAVLANI